jgi:hypothetical protein
MGSNRGERLFLFRQDWQDFEDSRDFARKPILFILKLARGRWVMAAIP